MASSVVLRIKRKRNDEPIEQLAVHGQQDLQKKIRLEDALNSLSLAQGGDKTSSTTTDTSPGTSIFVFSRIDTVSSASNDKQLQRRLEKSIQRYHSEMLKRDRVLKTKVNSKDVHQAQRQQKRIQRIYQGRGLNVVDVDVPRNEDNCDLLVNNTAMRTKSANRVLNPMERNIDEAIWIAFQRNDFSVFFQVKHQISNAYEFQRPADGGTILMAAAMHNRVDVIELLLAHSSASILLRDGHGKTAADIASDQGHAMAAAALRACESVEAEKDYVYDVYSIDITATQDITPSNSKKDLPVVSVSSSVERWLAHEAFGDLDSADRDLVYDVDGNDSDNEMLEDDEDSNDEDNVANDYPDEEESAFDSDDSRDHDINSDGEPWTKHRDWDDADDY